MSLNDRLQSFRFAARGLSWLIRSQPNARLHAAAAAAAVAAGFFLRIERLEWVAVALAIAAVVAAEAMNQMKLDCGHEVWVSLNADAARYIEL